VRKSKKEEGERRKEKKRGREKKRKMKHWRQRTFILDLKEGVKKQLDSFNATKGACLW